MIKLLIDECLTPDLVEIARARWVEAAHVSRIGRGGTADWQLVQFAIDGDWAMVTNNARDFRRLYKQVELHPGLLVILPQGRHDLQINLFRHLLDYLGDHSTIINQLIEIDENGLVTASDWSKAAL